MAGATADALGYEVEDMEQAIAGHPELMKLELTEDVMKMMTRIRKDWGLTYPEEEHATEKILGASLMQILTGSMISVVICMAAFVWMKKHPGNADFRVLYLISLNLEEFFAAHKSHHP